MAGRASGRRLKNWSLLQRVTDDGPTPRGLRANPPDNIVVSQLNDSLADALAASGASGTTAIGCRMFDI